MGETGPGDPPRGPPGVAIERRHRKPDAGTTAPGKRGPTTPPRATAAPSPLCHCCSLSLYPPHLILELSSRTPGEAPLPAPERLLLCFGRRSALSPPLRLRVRPRTSSLPPTASAHPPPASERYPAIPWTLHTSPLVRAHSAPSPSLSTPPTALWESPRPPQASPSLFTSSGPLVPVADVAVTRSTYGFDVRTGEAMAMGERTSVAILNAAASARMAVARSLTNLAAVHVGNLGRVKLTRLTISSSHGRPSLPWLLPPVASPSRGFARRPLTWKHLLSPLPASPLSPLRSPR
ncbi:hypothetical protein BD311DRAFT_811284 [Dichomitus squalens]|uniref:FGAR-AT PurM N-terminal-like domain-containing protein n=1 Tax=Dichomitus squalens TaxID=114155 RepID=A0A4Q9MAM1_9APHY|nr:hypothetical protein BD311DRAFT_811284 [Dichomitus squalens]